MAVGSFTNTSGDLPSDAVPHHYNDNNNPALDALSVFIAGRVTDNTGGLIQLTYTNIDNTTTWITLTFAHTQQS